MLPMDGIFSSIQLSNCRDIVSRPITPPPEGSELPAEAAVSVRFLDTLVNHLSRSTMYCTKHFFKDHGAGFSSARFADEHSATRESRLRNRMPGARLGSPSSLPCGASKSEAPFAEGLRAFSVPMR